MFEALCPIDTFDVRSHYAAAERSDERLDEGHVPTGDGTCLGPEHHQLRRSHDGARWYLK